MSIDKVGLNLTALGNLSPPTISINQTATEILKQLPQTANEITGGFFPYLILGSIFILTWWYLSDKSPLGEFRYSDVRALNLALGITASIGITQITVGFIQSWMAVVFVLLSFLLSNILLIYIENKQ